MPTESPDIIVIGAGHNGLVAACYLAKAGLDVLVLEANAGIGGCSTTDAYIKEAPQHRISPCAVDITFWNASTIVDDLDLPRYGYRTIALDPPYATAAPDGSSIAFWRDPKNTAEDIARFSKKDASAYLDLLDMLKTGVDVMIPFMASDPARPSAELMATVAGSVLRHPIHMAVLAPLALGTAVDAIESRFEDPRMRGAMLGFGALGAPVNLEGSGMNVFLPAVAGHTGITRMAGGTQVLVDSLAACLKDNGGRIRTGARVGEIRVADGRALGVSLADGEEIDARAVVAACDVVQTLRDLTPQSALPDKIKRRVAHMPTESGGASFLTVHMALSAQVDVSRLEKQRNDDVSLRTAALLLGSFEEMVAATEAAEAGRLPEGRMPVYAALPTGADPSLAPEGQEVAYLWTGWAPRNPPGGWDALAAEAGQKIIDTAADYYGGIKEKEIGRWVEPWPDLQKRVNLTDGNPYHVDFLASREGPFRPAFGLGRYTTPVEGLYLSGAGTHPGPSVSGLPGQHTARRVLTTLKAEDGGAPQEKGDSRITIN
ncbi:phytoene desaturase family protein [Sphingomonas bacterium]|uniref:phytoene desaturase family protein n=1 Tax=Sphingomonas bacterium TaxID=1895847 RepID=UPI001577278B|nr:NAD(P)/FAD-dependent oxidoreductase [Sphingomonas bacterium]